MGHVNLRKAKTRFLTTLGLGAPALILWASQETSMVLCKRSGSLRSFVRTSRSQVCHSFSSLHKLHQQASIFISQDEEGSNCPKQKVLVIDNSGLTLKSISSQFVFP